MGKERDQRQYLKDYPQLHKWVNECSEEFDKYLEQ